MKVNFSGIPIQSVIGRLLRLPLGLIPDGLVVPILQGPLKGMRWITGSSTHGCWLGSYEFDKQRTFASKVASFQGGCVYDLGAHVGFYTLLSSRGVGPTGQVIAFEPLPSNVSLLKRNLVLNGCTNCRIMEVAVSDRSGSAWFDAQPGRSSEGHLAPRGRVQVSVVVLDELIKEGNLPVPNVIKMDIEGAEYAALSGSTSLLDDYHPLIFLATHGAQVHRRCCDLLASLGYSLQALDGCAVEDTDEIIAVWSSPV